MNARAQEPHQLNEFKSPGEPDEVTQAVRSAASDSASYISGATLVVDGGRAESKCGTWANRKADCLYGRRRTGGN
jgi:NAD(P)-dependent dehydrogenase (short-subunit alcohol dehydrogenase family)